jgi:hypothetical protein
MRQLVAVTILVCVAAAACGRSEESAGRDDARAAPDDTTVVGHDHEDPMALRPIMQRLAADMAGLQNALWVEDFRGVEARAAAIADHAHISADEILRLERELGPDLEAFHHADESVHEAAVRMHEAAAADDIPALLDRLADVQRGCVDCHARFRERVRTSR